MNLLRHGLFWGDPLRWYERAGLVVWWLGQLVFGVCCVLALAVLFMTGFNRLGVDNALVLMLTGVALLFAARALLALAVRKRRRRGVRAY